MEKYLSFAEIAARLGVPTRTIYHLNSTGKGPMCTKVGRAFRVSEENLAKWLSDNNA